MIPEEDETQKDTETEGVPNAEPAAPPPADSAPPAPEAGPTDAEQPAPPAGAEPVAAEGAPPPVAEAPVAEETPSAAAEASPAAGPATPAEAPSTESRAPVEGTAPPVGERPRGRPSGGGRPERPGRDGDRRRGGGGGGRFGRRKVCGFCVEKAKAVDYKDPVKLRRYLSDRARIEPRRKTGTCAKHQRWLSVALKRARHLALLPYTPEHVRVTGVFPSRK